MYNKNDNLIFMKNIIIFILSFIIIGLLIIFYIFDLKNIEVQNYLNQIYNNKLELSKKFKKMIILNNKINYINNIIIIDNILDNEYFLFIKNQFNNKKYITNNYIYRKASGYDFFSLHNNKDYNGFLEIYYSNEIIEYLSNILKKPIQRPPLSDPNSCSLLIYSNQGDYIDWHYDFSNYYGDRYVVLLTIINENDKKTDLSHNEFHYMHENKEYIYKMKENSLVIFKGSEILHKSTKIEKNEKRIILSMVFCDICQEKKNIYTFIYENIKNKILYIK